MTIKQSIFLVVGTFLFCHQYYSGGCVPVPLREGTATATATATTAPKLRLSEQAVVTPDNPTRTTKRTTPTAASARTTFTAGTANAAGTTTSSAAILSKETRDSVVASMEVVMKTKVCNNSKQNRKSTWSPLCKGGITQRLKQLIQSPSLSESNRIRIVQIGAHTGWDENDPFIGGMTHLLDALPRDFRQRFVEYVFVEASPQVFPKLEENVQKHAHLCHFETINAGIMPDSHIAPNTTQPKPTLTFYSIRDTVDIHTGKDTLSGKKLPFWATQIGSFDRGHLLKHQFAFTKKGLSLKDYIVETPIPVLSLSGLVTDHTLFALVDTEGFDCNIILGTQILPRFLMYEVLHCSKEKKEAAAKYLGSKGFTLSGQNKIPGGFENVVAVA